MCARGTDNCLMFVYLQTDDGGDHMNGESDGSGPAPGAVKKWQFWKKKSTGPKKFGWIKGVLVSWFIKRIEICVGMCRRCRLERYCGLEKWKTF